MNKANVVRWIKKTVNLASEVVSADLLELDELYWFIGKKPLKHARTPT